MAPHSADEAATQPLKIVIVGHVDHGKSTLVGRLFHDTGSLPEGKLEAIQAMCERRGMPFEWAFLMDALKSERDQGITIDTSQIWFNTDKRKSVLTDAPGHKEFLKNMVSGAASADAAVLVIDAAEGVREQSRRHGYLLHLLGVRQRRLVAMMSVGNDELFIGHGTLNSLDERRIEDRPEAMRHVVFVAYLEWRILARGFLEPGVDPARGIVVEEEELSGLRVGEAQ